MKETMDLLIYDATDHVLAAFTEAGSGETVPDPAAVAGDGLLVRTNDGEVAARLESDSLRVERADRMETVLLQPPNYSFIDGIATFLPHDLAALTLSVNQLAVNRNVSADVEFFFIISGGDLTEPIEGSETLFAASNQGTALVSLTPGQTYFALALVPGLRPIAKKVTV